MVEKILLDTDMVIIMQPILNSNIKSKLNEAVRKSNKLLKSEQSTKTMESNYQLKKDKKI